MHQFHNGLYTESCFVLAEGELAAAASSVVEKIENWEICSQIKTTKYKKWGCAICPVGWYEDSIFHVSGFGFPPTEPSSATR